MSEAQAKAISKACTQKEEEETVGLSLGAEVLSLQWTKSIGWFQAIIVWLAQT